MEARRERPVCSCARSELAPDGATTVSAREDQMASTACAGGTLRWIRVRTPCPSKERNLGNRMTTRRRGNNIARSPGPVVMLRQDSRRARPSVQTEADQVAGSSGQRAVVVAARWRDRRRPSQAASVQAGPIPASHVVERGRDRRRCRNLGSHLARPRAAPCRGAAVAADAAEAHPWACRRHCGRRQRRQRRRLAGQGRGGRRSAARECPCDRA
jgi:hypothetical protein